MQLNIYQYGVAEPNYTKQYRLPHSQKAEAETYIQDMKKHGIIEQANSPWSSPFILVKKKDGTNRFVIDYRKLNDKTVKDRMPIPNVEELIDNLSQASIFSLLDLTSGYWQVPLAEQAKEKTVFTLNNNQYQFKVMPFGLCNSPATFQRLMMELTRDLPTTPYIDDIVVPAKSIEENISLLKNFFDRLREVNFKLKLKKCTFLSSQINYLGFIISNNTLEADPRKIEAIKKAEFPLTVKGLQRFLGMTNYLSRFISNYAETSKMLTSCQNQTQKQYSETLKSNRFELNWKDLLKFLKKNYAT